MELVYDEHNHCGGDYCVVDDLQAENNHLRAALQRMLHDLEQNINPTLARLGVHPADLSVKDIKEALG